MVYESIYIKCLENVSLYRQKEEQWSPREGGWKQRRQLGRITDRPKETLGVMNTLTTSITVKGVKLTLKCITLHTSLKNKTLGVITRHS